MITGKLCSPWLEWWKQTKKWTHTQAYLPQITEYSQLEKIHKDQVQLVNEWPYRDQTYKPGIISTMLKPNEVFNICLSSECATSTERAKISLSP